MNQLHILGPPRFGKKVDTPAEFFEKLKKGQIDLSESGSAAEVVDEKAPEEVGSVIVPGPYFVAPGRFNLGGITSHTNGYKFHDLELPMGCWEELELYLPALEIDHRGFYEWSDTTKSLQPDGVMPADIRYGLKVVCYQKRRNKLIQEVRREVFLKDCSDKVAYNSTMIDYGNNLILHGFGWPQGHPFAAESKADISGACSPIEQVNLQDDPSIGLALESVLGETDPKRCKKVLEWAMGVEGVYLYRDAVSSIKDVVLFERDRIARINMGIGELKTPRPARFIRADPKNYSRK